VGITLNVTLNSSAKTEMDNAIKMKSRINRKTSTKAIDVGELDRIIYDNYQLNYGIIKK